MGMPAGRFGALLNAGLVGLSGEVAAFLHLHYSLER
jgi:hypothetical protein